MSTKTKTKIRVVTTSRGPMSSRVPRFAVWPFALNRMLVWRLEWLQGESLYLGPNGTLNRTLLRRSRVLGILRSVS